MKKRNLIATNCPPGVDGNAQSACNDGKTGELFLFVLGFEEIEIINFFRFSTGNTTYRFSESHMISRSRAFFFRTDAKT